MLLLYKYNAHAIQLLALFYKRTKRKRHKAELCDMVSCVLSLRVYSLKALQKKKKNQCSSPTIYIVLKISQFICSLYNTNNTHFIRLVALVVHFVTVINVTTFLRTYINVVDWSYYSNTILPISE